MVRRLLNDEQMERRVQMCEYTLTELKTKLNMLSRVVTDDELWTIEYDSLTKLYSLKWKSASSPKPKKARLFKSNAR